LRLYRPEEHEPLDTRPWDETAALAAIQRIVADAEAAYDPVSLWPMHPRDGEDGWVDAPTTFYLGAAGVLWALDYLEEKGAVTLSRDYDAAKLHRRYLERPDFGEGVPSYFVGQTGLLLLMYKLDPRPETADRLEEQIRKSIPRPENEAMWAAPGTMLAALRMLAWTSEPRWRELWLAAADHVWAEWRHQPDLDCFLWTQDLAGKRRRFLGPIHGFAGNVYALRRGQFLLSPSRQLALVQRASEALERTAVQEQGLANWWPTADEPPEGGGRVQWCHGAPGMVCALIDSLPGCLELLLAGAELTWLAGPLAKGPSLCHGTAGNGFAFLKLHFLSNEPRWLHRARAFAMHAIEQSEDARRLHGQGRYTLWTGDLGLAVYLWHCLTVHPAVPMYDVF
jgi:hypothetical protein